MSLGLANLKSSSTYTKLAWPTHFDLVRQSREPILNSLAPLFEYGKGECPCRLLAHQILV
jgi:hypothetical protein